MKTIEITCRKITQSALILVLSGTWLTGAADEILSIQFENDGAVDQAMNHIIEAEGLIVMGFPPAAYAELDGRTGMEIAPDPIFQFQPGDSLWVEAWVEPLRFGSGGAIVSKGSGSNYQLQIDKSGHLAFSYYSQGEWRSLIAPEPLEVNAWQHVACHFDASGSIRLFVDGTLVAQKDGMPPFQSRDETPLYVGATRKSATDEYSGWIGALGPLTLAKGNPRDIAFDTPVGSKAFEINSPF